MITNPNRVIFDSVDTSLSYLSKSTIFPNLYHQFIVRFDQIPKDLSKIPYFPCGFDPYLPLYPLIRVNFIKMGSLVLFLTQIGVQLMTTLICSIKGIVKKYGRMKNGILYEMNY